MSSLVSFRLPDELLRKLNEVSQITERSKTFIVKKALENYLEEYVDYQIALDRLHDKDDDIITPAEMRRELGL